jgi:ADP-ribose pyrophosphatase YjhB (NUDIX family)
MYVIFYNNKPILLTENESKCNNYKQFDIDSFALNEVLQLLTKTDLQGVCFPSKNVDELYQKFVKNFKIIEAAGGLVTNATNELLFIFRNGVWDLPKGKVELNESIGEAALREVEEECGVKDLQLESFFDKTYHIYEYKNQLIFKITHWFTMHSNSESALIPQLEEGITKVAFLDKTAQQEALKNTYPNLIILLKKYNSQ